MPKKTLFADATARQSLIDYLNYVYEEIEFPDDANLRGEINSRIFGCALPEIELSFDDAKATIDRYFEEHALDLSLGRVPEVQKPAEPHWITLDKERKTFWIEVNERCKKHGLKPGKPTDAFVHAALEVEHIEDYPGTRLLAESVIQEALEEQYPIEQSVAEQKEEIKKLFKAAGLTVNFQAATGFPTYDAAIIVLSHDDIREMVRAWIAERKQPPAPIEAATNGDAVSGEVVDMPLPTPAAPERHLAVVNNPSKPLTRNEPNRYWLTSPAWQLDPFTLAKWAAESKLYKGIDTVDKAMMCMLKGVNLGVDPTTALENVYLIPDRDGRLKTAISGILMSALLQSKGVKIEYPVRTDERCTVKITRPDNGLSYTTTFTIEDARRLKLTDKNNWRYARSMLTWRALSECARFSCSDIMLGMGMPMYIPEELDPDGVYDEDGTKVA